MGFSSPDSKKNLRLAVQSRYKVQGRLYLHNTVLSGRSSVAWSSPLQGDECLTGS